MTPDWDFNGDGELLCVDKPEGWTSFDVVRKVRNLFHIRKIGHAGTLDPLATGLLILCTGRRTKELSELIGRDKEYAGTLTLGKETASYDRETPVLAERPWTGVDHDALHKAMRALTGPQQQLPPMYSAVKHKGRALYKYAREGAEVARKPRDIVVERFEAEEVRLPDVHFRVVCSKGTYIRTLVHDMGSQLGCGAILTTLRRERIGEWHVRDAWTIDRLISVKGSRKGSRGERRGVLSSS